MTGLTLFSNSLFSSAYKIWVGDEVLVEKVCSYTYYNVILLWII